MLLNSKCHFKLMIYCFQKILTENDEILMYYLFLFSNCDFNNELVNGSSGTKYTPRKLTQKNSNLSYLKIHDWMKELDKTGEKDKKTENYSCWPDLCKNYKLGGPAIDWFVDLFSGTHEPMSLFHSLNPQLDFSCSQVWIKRS